MDFTGIVKKYIEIHEGKKFTVYTDTRGNKTIGVGFNLSRPGAKQKIESYGLSYEDVCSGRLKLDERYVNIFLLHDCQIAIRTARKFCSTFDNLSVMRQIVLIDMAFNLGEGGLSTFKKFQEALKNKNWEQAAIEMKNSKWYNQVKTRGEHNIYAMRMDKPHPDMMKAGLTALTTTVNNPATMWGHKPNSRKEIEENIQKEIAYQIVLIGPYTLWLPRPRL